MSFELDVWIKASVFLAGAGLLTAAFRNASASIRHAIWILAVSAALALPLLSATVPAINLPLVSGYEAKAGGTMPVVSLWTKGLAQIESQEPLVFADTTGTPPWSAKRLLPVLWAVGAFAVLFRWALGVREVRKLRHQSNPMADQSRLRLLSELRATFSVSAPVQLRLGGNGVPPLTWGILRHAILLPSSSEHWSDERLRLVIAHELAHIRRRDGMLQIITLAACAVHWFNPLVWYAAYRIRIERERACDDRVLNLGFAAESYADHLLKIAREVRIGWNLAPLSMLTGLEKRLRAILDKGKNRKAMSVPGMASWLGSAALLAVLTASVHLTAFSVPPLPPPPSGRPPVQNAVPSTPQAALEPGGPMVKNKIFFFELWEKALEERSQQQPAPVSPLRRWVDMDALYIATEAERRTFSSLMTDAEREMFIEQFWEGRDPSPGTTGNEFRDELYRRIAYATTNFTSTVPGWQTDRGHIYIVLGPPDVVQSGKGEIPSETWIYRFIEGIGNVAIVFVDPSQTGEYRMAATPRELLGIRNR